MNARVRATAQHDHWAGVAAIVGGSLLGRHRWRTLGASLTGAVIVRPDQVVVDRGAYRYVRHPSYTAGALLFCGIGLALANEISLLSLMVTVVGVYGYRVIVLRSDSDTVWATHMAEPLHHSWVRAAVLLGAGYALVGIVFAIPAAHVGAWRGAAWVVSAMGYAAHIAYERFWLRNSAGSAALHVAFAVALGAFGLAVGANIHSLSTGQTNQHQQLLLLSLAIWPVVTAFPAFLVSLGANVILAHALGGARGQ